ncbi:MAG: hypothetical protein NVS4B10_06840 [Myxococcales bacterium]
MSGPRALAALSQLQQLLQSINGVEAGPVADFMVGEDERARLAPATSPDEALLVCEDGETLRVGLFLDPAVLSQLSRAHRDPWSLSRLRGFCHAAEGVSHFLYLAHRAQQGRPVSLLELEAQAEVDKYLCVVLQLWATGRRGASPELRRRLFERASLRPGLDAAERDRYRLANQLAAATARVLEARFVAQGRLEALLREARRLYRLGGGEKLTALSQGLLAAA